jgi:CubicO group peptidase (beta-lactamase class C family)
MHELRAFSGKDAHGLMAETRPRLHSHLAAISDARIRAIRVHLAIAHRHRIIAEGAFGHANIAKGDKLMPPHRVRIASHSKSFTATGYPIAPASSATAPIPASSPTAPFARGHTGKVLLGKRLIIPGDNLTNAIAPAAGFVSTASDVARYFAQLAPNAKRSVLSLGSRREMIRRHWRNPHSSQEVYYGLGWAAFWIDGVIHILHTIATRGAPTRRVRDWTGGTAVGCTRGSGYGASIRNDQTCRGR